MCNRLVLLGMLIAMPIGWAACAQDSRDRAPGRETAAPAAPLSPVASLPAVTDEALDAALAATPGLSAFVLARGDRIVRERYADGRSFERAVNIKSASKGVLNALAGIALERGHIRSLDTPISDYLADYFTDLPVNDARRSITVEHLLTMSSGLRSTSIHSYGAWVSSRDWIGYALQQELVHPPGSRMTYSTGDTHLLAAVLTEATGMTLRTYAQRYLFDALDVRIGGWDRDPQGYYFGGNNMALSPKALLGLGRLYLNEGRHEGGRQLFTAEWIAQSWTPRFFNSSFNMRHDYGYLWWHTNLAGHSTWFAWGYGGQFLFIVPSLDAVVVLLGDPDAPARSGNSHVYDLMERTIVPYLQRRALPGG